MANWLEITNTLINLETMSRVGELSRYQQQAASQAEQAQRDNWCLTQIVDVFVKVKELVQDQRFFDALITSGCGIMLYKQLYPGIINADTKLKAAELEMKLKDAIHEIATNPSMNSQIQAAYEDFLKSLVDSISRATDVIKKTRYTLVWLGRKGDVSVQVGDELVAVYEIPAKDKSIILFSSGKLYRVVALDQRYKNGFVLENDHRVRNLLNFAKAYGNGHCFARLSPPLPNLREKLAAYSMVEKFFGQDFLGENLRSLIAPLTSLRESAYSSINLTTESLQAKIVDLNLLREKVAADKNNLAKVVKELRKLTPGVIIINLILLLIGLWFFIHMLNSTK